MDIAVIPDHKGAIFVGSFWESGDGACLNKIEFTTLKGPLDIQRIAEGLFKMCRPFTESVELRFG